MDMLVFGYAMQAVTRCSSHDCGTTATGTAGHHDPCELLPAAWTMLATIATAVLVGGFGGALVS